MRQKLGWTKVGSLGANGNENKQRSITDAILVLEWIEFSEKRPELHPPLPWNR